MKTVGRVLFFIVIVILSALGLLGLFPFAKEGFSRDLIPFLFGGALAFVVLGALWWWAVGRDLLKAIPAWFVLAIPSIAYLMAAVALVLAMLRGDQLSSQAAIENFREEPILWEGFEGPVGWRISFDLLHPEGASGLIVPPEIRMGPAADIPAAEISATRTGGSGTFKDRYLDEEVGPLALLKTVLFQRTYKNPQAKRSYDAWTSANRFDEGGRTALAYHLHPGLVDYLESTDRLCVGAWSPGIPECRSEQRTEDGCRVPGRSRAIDPIYHQGGDLTANWAAFGGNDMVADFSAQLTETLRRESRLQDDPGAWQAMQKRLEPANLLARGYALCPPGDDSHTAFRTCYCRAPGSP